MELNQMCKFICTHYACTNKFIQVHIHIYHTAVRAILKYVIDAWIFGLKERDIG
jgi:hypothetical protein